MTVTDDTIDLEPVERELDAWSVPPSQISGPLPVQRSRRRRRPCPHCRARHRAYVVAALAAAGVLAGAAYAAVTIPAPARQAAAFSRPAAVAPVLTPLPAPPGWSEPRPHLVLMPTSHATAAQQTSHSSTSQQPTSHATTSAPQPPTTHANPGYTAPATSQPTQPPSPSATATTHPVTTPPPSATTGAAMLNRALAMAGVPYAYGGSSPAGFDCSGLVYWAAQQTGITLPRTTYGMLASPRLVRVSIPRYGDLAFFGSGHVEFYVKPGETFGAEKPGTVVGYHSYGYGYIPTGYYRIA